MSELGRNRVAREVLAQSARSKKEAACPLCEGVEGELEDAHGEAVLVRHTTIESYRLKPEVVNIK
jgi:hypothetical protein